MPEFYSYKPVGISMSDAEIINLTIDEFEAIRLADYEDLYQEEAAERMGVSRQTLGRIVDSAHKKIADAMINGKVMVIEGGSFEIHDKKVHKCQKCRKRIKKI
jgi:predicted DNA-binding protein (UPF0251 family)